MSEFDLFQSEKQKLDSYVAQEFRIVGVLEDLEGAWLDLEHPGGETAKLHLTTANARKYYVNVLLTQGKNKA